MLSLIFLANFDLYQSTAAVWLEVPIILTVQPISHSFSLLHTASR
jgi:hypothetical protein